MRPRDLVAFACCLALWTAGGCGVQKVGDGRGGAPAGGGNGSVGGNAGGAGVGGVIAAGGASANGGASSNGGVIGNGGGTTSNGGSGAGGGTAGASSVGAGGAAPPGWYVDSVAGKDTNDGRSPRTPFASLAQLSKSASETGVVVYLARGGVWREELTGLPQGVEVRPYGVGERPLIDGSDVAPNVAFKKTAGLNHVYEIPWTHSFAPDSGKTAHRAWENNTRLRRALTLAACDATPGSFFAAPPTTGGPDTIYIHPSDASAVPTNGKVYELTRRRWAVQLYTLRNHASVYSVHTRRNANADGSLVVDGLISDCLAEDGRVHNVFIRGTAEDCTAWKIEPPDILGSATMFVTYEDQIDLPGVTYRRCRAIAETDALSAGGSTNPFMTVGFFAHTGGGKSIGTAVYEDCSAAGFTQSFGLQQVDNALYYKCVVDGFHIAVASLPRQTLAVLGGTFRTRSQNASLVRFSDDYGVPKKILIRGVRYTSEIDAVQPIWINREGAYSEITRCTFGQLGGGIFKLQRGSFVVTNNIFHGNNFVVDWSPPLANYTADQNLYFETNANPALFSVSQSIGYTGLPAWRAATGQDLRSIDADPLFVGSPRLGNFQVDPKSPAWNLAAGAEYQSEEADTTLQAYRSAVASGKP